MTRSPPPICSSALRATRTPMPAACCWRPLSAISAARTRRARHGQGCARSIPIFPWPNAPASCPTRTPPTSSASSTGWRRPDCPSDLFLHEGIQIRRPDRMVEVGEGPLLLHFLRRIQKTGHRGAVERGREADALDAGGLEVGLGEGTALYADHEVERLVERP